jgi:hypothetical protein
MRGVTVMALVVVVSAALAGIEANASDEQPAARVIDRTVLCATGLSGGIHEIEIEAKSASGPRRDQADGHVTVGSNVQPISLFASITQAALDLNPACRRARATVGLRSRGLTGWTASRTYETVDCTTAPRVLIRVRVAFTRPVTLRRTTEFQYPQLTARAPVREGTIAVRTETGKRLVLARLLRSGKVQVFADVPRSCIPD